MSTTPAPSIPRRHDLDALRAIAMLLGIALPSYWLYLTHIPLIIYAQYWVRDYPLPPFLKFLIVCVVTSVLLLLSYQLLIRYTPIGTLLNGKRNRPKAASAATDSGATDSESSTTVGRPQPAEGSVA
ncbi:hypothetical protein NZK35_28800 [Stieleria sp. ICT_E10.1]|uniref:hypothetical protein n=1 Tax=Stieleria sedimenti TaxID=2976331 RepID=UPI00217FD92D|nr:hypothetical protein [Stieleria sedimenti]MCS7470670.1 hypothetical protein [Stieleria sedimenti]